MTEDNRFRRHVAHIGWISLAFFFMVWIFKDVEAAAFSAMIGFILGVLGVRPE